MSTANENDGSGCATAVGMALMAVVFSCVLYGVGRDEGVKAEHEAAIKAGVGRYEVNAATGTTKFVYGVKPDPRPDHPYPAETTSR